MNLSRNANRTFSLLLAASMLFSGGAFQPTVSACSSQSCDQDCCCSSFKTNQEAASGCCRRTNTKSRSCCRRSADQPRKAICCKASQQPGKGCLCQTRQQSHTPLQPERNHTTRRQLERLLVQQLSDTSLTVLSANDTNAYNILDNPTADPTPSDQTLLCVWLT